MKAFTEALSVKSPMADGAPLQFFSTVYQIAHQAANSVGGFIDRSYQIGGFEIRLRFAAYVPQVVESSASK